MTEHLGLTAELRETTGKGPARQMRMKGRIPAIIYGGGQGEVKISLDTNELTKKYLKGKFKSKIIDIKIGNDIIKTLPRDIQLHPVTDVPEHADFVRVNDDTIVHVLVAVEIINHEKSPGLKRGGVLNVVRRHIEVYSRADSIPDHLTVDLDGLKVGASLHSSNVNYPAGVTPVIKDRDFTIAAILGRTAQADEEETAAEEVEGDEAAAEGAEATGEAAAE